MTPEDFDTQDISRKAAARIRAKGLARIVMPLRWKGATLQDIAHALNDAGIKTVEGKMWHPSQVRRVIQRLTE